MSLYNQAITTYLEYISKNNNKTGIKNNELYNFLLFKFNCQLFERILDTTQIIYKELEMYRTALIYTFKYVYMYIYEYEYIY